MNDVKLALRTLFKTPFVTLVAAVSSALLLVATAFAAGFIPALSASRIDPMRALRYE